MGRVDQASAPRCHHSSGNKLDFCNVLFGLLGFCFFYDAFQRKCFALPSDLAAAKPKPSIVLSMAVVVPELVGSNHPGPTI